MLVTDLVTCIRRPIRLMVTTVNWRLWSWMEWVERGVVWIGGRVIFKVVMPTVKVILSGWVSGIRLYAKVIL